MSVVRVGGVALYCRVRGRGAPVLLLHGFAGSGGSWGGVVPALERHWRVLVPDLIGHGRSDVPPQAERYGFDRCVGDVAALLERQRAVPAHVVGYSMGGRVALGLAIHYPGLVRSLVLEGASPGIADAAEREERRRSDARLAAEIERDGVEAFARRWLAQPLFASIARRGEAAFARALALRCTGTAAGLSRALRGLGCGTMPPLWDRLAEVRVPALLVAGEQDAKYRALGAQMAARMPAARAAVVAGCGHCTHFEEPEQFAALVAAFLRQVESGRNGERPARGAVRRE